MLFLEPCRPLAISTDHQMWAFFIPICVLSAHGIIREARPYSLNLMFHVFNLVFFGVAPVAQIASGAIIWGVSPTESEVLRANCMVVMFALMFTIGRSRAVKWHMSAAKTGAHGIAPLGVLGLCCAMMAGIWLAITRAGADAFFYKSLARGATLSEETAINVLFDNVLRQLPAVALVAGLAANPRAGKGSLALLALFVVVLDNPVSAYRYLFGAVCIALYVALGRHWIVSKQRFLVPMMLGLLIAYPLLGLLRNVGSENVALDWSFQAKVSGGDFDAYYVVIASLRHIDYYGYEWGSQAVGACLFFVPRSLWPSKPIGSGAMMANAGNWEFTNISCPAVAEAMLNFGYVGVLLAGLVYGIVVGRLDMRFWTGSLAIGATVFRVFYPMMLGLIIINLRGDMMSSLAFIACNFACCHIVVASAGRSLIRR